MKTFEAITRGSRNNTRRDLIIQFTDDWLFHGSARVKRLSILDPCQGMFNRGVEDRVISSLILATTLSVKDGPVLYDTARLSSFHTDSHPSREKTNIPLVATSTARSVFKMQRRSSLLRNFFKLKS